MNQHIPHAFKWTNILQIIPATSASHSVHFYNIIGLDTVTQWREASKVQSLSLMATGLSDAQKILQCHEIHTHWRINVQASTGPSPQQFAFSL
jgi:hypothetical protein